MLNFSPLIAQLPFTKWNFKKIKQLYNLSVNMFEELPKFKAQMSQAPEDIFKHITEDLMVRLDGTWQVMAQSQCYIHLFI